MWVFPDGRMFLDMGIVDGLNAWALMKKFRPEFDEQVAVLRHGNRVLPSEVARCIPVARGRATMRHAPVKTAALEAQFWERALDYASRRSGVDRAYLSEATAIWQHRYEPGRRHAEADRMRRLKELDDRWSARASGRS